jgi:ATP-dependent DNA helicase RecG
LLQNIGAIRSDGNILPQPAMYVYHYSYDAGDILVVEVEPAHFPPVRYKGQIWVRIGPRRGVANEAEEKLLTEKRTSNSRTFDERPCFESTLDDLELDRFKLKYLPMAVDSAVLENDRRDIKLQLASLRFYDLVRDCPTNAGVLMFGKRTPYFFPGAYVQYVRFDGKKVSDTVVKETQFKGNLIAIVEGLNAFVDNVIIDERPVFVSTLQENIIRNYPKWAIREFLMNALMHRSYEINTPIKFYQFSDRLLIENPGGLYGNASPDNFPNVSDYRNLVVAEGMRVLGYVNRFNRGVATAEEVLAENGNSAPAFNIKTQGVFGVTILEKTIYSAIGGGTGGVSGGVKQDADAEKAILEVIKNNPGVKTKRIAEISDIPQRTVERHLKKMKDSSIEYRGPAKTGGYYLKLNGQENE